MLGTICLVQTLAIRVSSAGCCANREVELMEKAEGDSTGVHQSHRRLGMHRRQWLFVAAMSLLVGFIMCVERSWPSLGQANYSGEPHAEPSARDRNAQRSETFWERTTNNPDTFFSACVAAFTCILAVSTAGLWVATLLIGQRQSLDMAGLITATAAQVEAMNTLRSVVELQAQEWQQQAAVMRYAARAERSLTVSKPLKDM